jgi:lysophospholipase L1-like esterase
MRLRADGVIVWPSPTAEQRLVLEGPADAEPRRVLLRDVPFFRFGSPVPLWAIGDSWLFNVLAPMDLDLVDALGDVGYRVVHALTNRYSRLGRTLAEMASPDLIEMYRQDLVDAIDGGSDTAPKAILLGGGGNDLIDPAQEGRRHESTLHALLKGPAGSAQDAVDEAVLAGYLGRMQGHLDRLIEGLAEVTDVPLLVHAYDHPIPDGRDVFSSSLGDVVEKFKLTDTPGPWLDPVFRLRGMHDQRFNAGVMRHLIDRLNAAVGDTVDAHRKRGRNVHHLRFAGTLGGAAGYGADGAAADLYRRFWRDELHPTAAGHALLAAVAARQLADLGLEPA